MKQFFSLVLIFIFIFAGHLSSQSLKPFKLENNVQVKLHEKFKEFETFRFSFDALAASLQTRSNIKQIEIAGSSFQWKIQLYEYNLYSNDFIRMTGTDQGVIKSFDKPKARTFYGDVLSKRGGQARITCDERFIAGYLEDNGIRYFIEPVNGMLSGIEDDILIVYKESDMKELPGIQCGLDLYKKYQPHVDIEGVENNINNRSHCLEVEIALANDFTVFTFRGGQNQAETWNATILNLMQANYDNEFQHSLELVQTGSFTATSNASDPWNGINNINNHLDRHASWGNGGGYGGAGYDVATAWTRKYTSGAVGLAWVGVICNSLRYNVCSDYGAGNGFIRQLQAHEVGHNFSAGHDAPGSGFIMAPSVNGSNTWSSASISSINAHVNSRGCLGPCSSGVPPVADFTSDITSGCVPFTVNFRDQSLNDPTSWLWEFPGGTPTTSTLKNPSIQYKTRGIFQVKLTVRNNFGSDVLTISSYIEAYDLPTSSFTHSKSDRTVFFRNTSQYGETYFWDFGDGETSNEENPVHEYLDDGEYEVILTVENVCGTKTSKLKITVVSPPVLVYFADTTYGCASYTVKFINKSSTNVTKWDWDFPGGNPSKSNAFEPTVSYNYQGEFDVTLTATNSKFNTKLTKPKYIKVDTASIAAFNYTLNGMEVTFGNQSSHAKSYQWNFGDNNTSTEKDPKHTYTKNGKYNVQLITTSVCGNDTTFHEITIGSGLAANFKANQKGCVPYTVTFDNTSTGASSFQWSFPGGSPSSSTEKNPTIVYNAAGTFDVTLVASDGTNSITLKETSYITVGQSPSSEFSHAVQGLSTFFTNNSKFGNSYHWDFGDNTESTEQSPSHTYKSEGEFTVKLKVTNDCGVSEFSKLIVVYLIPKVNFTSNLIEVCQGDEVKYIDLSSQDVVEWKWQFENGTPDASAEKNPIVVYNKTGIFAVKLSVKNSNGENALTKTAYIKVYSNVLCPDYKYDLPTDPGGGGLAKGGKFRNQNAAVHISPNPFHDDIRIRALLSGENPLLSIFDLQGKLQMQQMLPIEKGWIDQRISLQGLPAGTYFLELSNSVEKKIQPLVKL